MTPDPSAALLAGLDRAEQLDRDATPAPWEADDANAWVVGGPFAERMAGMCIAEVSDDADGRADAEFIAAARSGWPAAVGAIRRVLALHQPITVQTGSKTHGGGPQYGQRCAVCRSSDLYPCATVRALTEDNGQ